MYPRYSTFHMAAGICSCDACAPRQRPATRRVILDGDPYDRNTLLVGEWSFGFAPLFKTHKKQPEPPDDEDHGRTFMLGRFCAARSELYHRLHHYKHYTLERVKIEMGHYRNREEDGGGGYGPDATVEEVFQRLADEGFVNMVSTGSV